MKNLIDLIRNIEEKDYLEEVKNHVQKHIEVNDSKLNSFLLQYVEHKGIECKANELEAALIKLDIDEFGDISASKRADDFVNFFDNHMK